MLEETKGFRMTLHDEAAQAFEKAIKLMGEDAFKQTSMFLKGRVETAELELQKAA